MLFSQRKGLRPVRVEIQREGMDTALRNRLWSTVHFRIFDVLSPSQISSVAKYVWMNLFEEPVDEVPNDFRAFFRRWFLNDADWHGVYDGIESIWAALALLEYDYLDASIRSALAETVNIVLERELSAYRFVDGNFVELTAAEEVSAVEEALEATAVRSPVRTHLQTSLSMLSDRQKPDYRNSVKESISAVEALCKIIAGERSATLGDALKRLVDAGVVIHPSLRLGWLKIYGYTNDSGGIRHALTDEQEIGFAEAKYMLVSCSAFVNLLLDLSREAGLSIKV